MRKIDINQILIPIDFSETSRLAIEQAGFMARLFKADINLVHVMRVLSSVIPIRELSEMYPEASKVEEIVKAELATITSKIKEKYSVNVKEEINSGSIYRWDC